MAAIDNPRHSRPIDVHRWSDHPEVKALADWIWDKCMPSQINEKPGPKPKTAFKKQLRVLILDLYVAWLEDPELSIGVSMSVNAWKTNSRYNAIHLSKKILDIINALHAASLIDLAKGSYAGPGARGNRTTRIRASEELQDLFREAKFRREDIARCKSEEVIILRDANEANKRGKEVEYEDTEDTIAMREELRAYNELLASSFIDIATLQKPVIEVDPEIEASHVHIHPDNTRTRRVFSRSNWQMNGRFYGGWWQRINEDWRSKIFINDQPVVEVDFKGLHISMLHAEAGEEMVADPYDIPREIFQAYPKEVVRPLVKRLALTAINAKEKSSAFKAFREGFSGGTPLDALGRRMTDEKLDRLLGAFLTHNPVLTNYLFTDQGIRLMYLDSQITARIHRHFTEQGVPVLSIHDSYLIDVMKVDELRQVMADASEAVVGRALPTAIKLPDKPEYSLVSDEEIQEHVENRVRSRCAGYMDRVFDYQERTGRSICPVGRGDAEIDHRLGVLG